MSEQREKPGLTPPQLCARMGVPHHPETKVSGGQFENFREGWAFADLTQCNAAHYFKRTSFSNARSKCGVMAEVQWLYGEGNFQRCRRCAKLVKK